MDRIELTEALADYYIATGNVRESLRDVAPNVGTSARMLLHYFDSREAMIDAALEVARARQLSAAQKVLDSSPNAESALVNVWNWYKRKDTLQFFVLFTDVAALERSFPSGQQHFGARLGTDWVPMFEQVFEDRSIARLIIATIRGLALDLHNGVAVRDQKATYDALAKMILTR